MKVMRKLALAPPDGSPFATSKKEEEDD